jgi:hypothetical protein
VSTYCVARRSVRHRYPPHRTRWPAARPELHPGFGGGRSVARGRRGLRGNRFDSFPWWGYSLIVRIGIEPAPPVPTPTRQRGDIEGWVWAVDDGNGNHPSPLPPHGYALYSAYVDSHPTPLQLQLRLLRSPRSPIRSDLRDQPTGSSSRSRIGEPHCRLDWLTLREQQGNVYTFPAFTLQVGGLLKIYPAPEPIRRVTCVDAPSAAMERQQGSCPRAILPVCLDSVIPTPIGWVLC